MLHADYIIATNNIVFSYKSFFMQIIELIYDATIKIAKCKVKVKIKIL